MNDTPSAEPSRQTVVVVASNTTVSGGETFLLRLAKHSPSLRAPSLFITLGFGNGQLNKELEAAGARVLPLQAPALSSPFGTLAIARRIAAEAKAIGAEAILANGTHPFVYASLAGASSGLPVGQWMHDVPPRRLVPVSTQERIVHLMRDNALFLCNSQFTLEASMELRPRGAILRLCPPGQEFLDEEPAETQALREKLGLHPDKVVLGFAGRMAAIKGVWHMARALEKVATLKDRAQVMLVGGNNLGQEKDTPDEIERIIRGAGFHVVRTGHVSPVIPYLRAMDVMLAPSIFQETFGLSVMEAMACGKPVIGTRIGALPELVRDGVTGWLVRPGDDEDLAQAITSAVTDAEARSARGQAARERVRKRFSTDVMVRSFEGALSVLKRI